MTTTIEHKPLGQLLVTRGCVSAEQVERALAEQKRSNHRKLLGEVLVELRACDEAQVAEAVAAAHGAPFARVTPKLCDPKAVGLLPRAFVERHGVLPLFLVEGTLTLAVPEPSNLFLIEEVERVAGYPVQVVVATPRDIAATIKAYLPTERAFDVGGLSSAPASADDDSPAARLAHHYVAEAVHEGATDVHVEPAENAVRVRYRIDGRLVERLRPPAAMGDALVSRLKAIAGIDPAASRVPREGTARVTVDGRPIDLRVSTMPARWGEKVVVRIADNERAAAVNLERLGFGYETLKQWRKLLHRDGGGTLLVTGPAGSGKASTAYASLRELNAAELNVCTVEDPVAQSLPGVNQFQVDEAAGFTYPAAIESLLRQDPDVVMIGTMPDPATARAVTHAAMAGRLVLATLLAPDAASAVVRLASMGVEPYLVGASVAGVLAQRLVRKLCQACREPYAPTIQERRMLDAFGGGGGGGGGGAADTLYRPKGCARCHHLGYLGRIGIFELLTMNDELAERVSRGASLAELRELARLHDFKALRADGIDKVRAGITTINEVLRVTA